jgi:hypothetical protein
MYLGMRLYRPSRLAPVGPEGLAERELRNLPERANIC